MVVRSKNIQYIDQYKRQIRPIYTIKINESTATISEIKIQANQEQVRVRHPAEIMWRTSGIEPGTFRPAWRHPNQHYYLTGTLWRTHSHSADVTRRTCWASAWCCTPATHAPAPGPPGGAGPCPRGGWGCRRRSRPSPPTTAWPTSGRCGSLLRKGGEECQRPGGLVFMVVALLDVVSISILFKNIKLYLNATLPLSLKWTFVNWDYLH
jgi:hypothetical protein